MKAISTSLTALLIVLFTGCAPTPGSKSSPDQPFDDFKHAFIEELWQLDPSWAINAGRHEFDSLLTIPSASQREKTQARLGQLRQRLHRFRLQQLPAANQIDFKLIDNYINQSRWYASEFRSYEWNPASYNVGSGFAQILNGRYAPLDVRLHALLHRLQYVPEYYQAAQANISNPTIEHTGLAIAQSKGALEVFGQAMADSVAKSGLSPAQKTLFTIRRGQAQKAIQAYIDFLTQLRQNLSPATARSFRIGKEQFARKFELDIVSGYSADEIYRKAQARKKYLHTQMAKLSRQLWPAYMGTAAMPADSLQMINQVIERIAQKHTHRDSFLIEIERQIPELVAFVNSKNLLTQDPNKPLVVRETPAYMAGVAGASISAPGPYDSSADTYYNVTPLTGYTPAQAESYLREYNHYILQILNIHEAIPGHYTQLMYSNRSHSIVKSILSNGAMIEGWAVYTELMMLEEGYNNSPEMWLMYYKWNMRVTMNTILDYSVHVLNISETDALNMLKNEAFQEQAEATGKWKRATLSQVQLCSYFTGFQEIYDLREELKKKQGARFNLKEFHEEFLSYGSAPVKYIRELMMARYM